MQTMTDGDTYTREMAEHLAKKLPSLALALACAAWAEARRGEEPTTDYPAGSESLAREHAAATAPYQADCKRYDALAGGYVEQRASCAPSSKVPGRSLGSPSAPRARC